MDENVKRNIESARARINEGLADLNGYVDHRRLVVFQRAEQDLARALIRVDALLREAEHEAVKSTHIL